MAATCVNRPRPLVRRRAAYGVVTVVLAAALAIVLAQQGGWWQLAVFGLGPDLALLAGGGRGLERGQLHRRAVPFYNAAHRVAGPLALGVLALAGLPLTVAALAWGCPVCLDRAVGYGLRTHDGFQRS